MGAHTGMPASGAAVGEGTPTAGATARDLWLPLLGARVHWADFGGPASPEALCVMVHGLGGSSVNWESLAPLLVDRFRCLALDLVGFGLTEPGPRTARISDNTQVLAAFVERVRVAHPGVPLLLVGNSMGGLICARYAVSTGPHARAGSHAPAGPYALTSGELAGVVLLDPTVPPAHLVPGPGGILAAGLYAVPALGQAAARARRSLRSPAQNVQDTLRLCTVDPARVDPDVVARHLPVAQRRVSHPEMDRHYSDAARSILGTLARRRRADRVFTAVDVPVLLVHGTRDRLVPFSGAARTAGRNPRWRFVPASDCGHLPMLEHPQWLAAQLRTWWEGRERDGAAGPMLERHDDAGPTLEREGRASSSRGPLRSHGPLGPVVDLQVVRRKAATAALLLFRALPEPVKMLLVRNGTPNYTVGAVCALEHDGRVLMLSQPHRQGWSLPGGLLEHDETPADAVAREVREETGLEIEPGDHIAAGVHPRTQSVDIVFRVVLERRPSPVLSAEARRSRWFGYDEVTDADRETRQILALLRRSRQAPSPGRLLR